MKPSIQTFEQLPSMNPMMLRAALPSGKGPLKSGATIPKIVTTVPRLLVLPKELARYRKVCGFVPSDRVPPTWLQVLAGPLHMAILADKTFPLPAMGIVHVRNRIEQLAPLAIADTIEMTAHVEGHRTAKRGVEFDLVTEVSRNGTLIWKSVATVLSMVGHKGGGHKGASNRASTPPPAGEQPNRTHSVIWPVAEDQGRKYAAVSGDRNPIHLHAVSAKLFGFRRAIVHGMWSLGRCLAELEDVTPESGLCVDVSFRRPIFLPSRVLFSAGAIEAEDVEPDGAYPVNISAFAVRTPDAAKTHLSGAVRASAAAPSVKTRR